MAAWANPVSRLRVRGAAAVTALAVLVIGAPPAAVASPPAAACQEYVVCGQPAGGPSGNGGNPASAGPRFSPHKQQPSVSSQADLPLTAYPVTPALAILAGVLLAGLLVAMAVRLARGGDDRRARATSARAR